MSNEEHASTKELEEFEPWTYPQIELLVEPQASTAQEEPQEEPEPEAETFPEQEDEELKALKQGLNEQISQLSTLNVSLQTMLDALDEQLFLDIVAAVKKVSTALIKKELASDKDCLQAMIKGFLNDIEPYKQCKILLSSEDYQRIEAASFKDERLSFEVSESLHSGDFKLSTSSAELSALMEKRLQAFFGLDV